MRDDNFDALWLYKYDSPLREWYKQNYGDDGRLLISDVSASLIGDYITKSLSESSKPTGKILPETKETKMGYSDYDNRDNRSDQEKIDDAVREALAAPRREAEIAKRVALVGTLEQLAGVEVGTVITFSKKNDRGDKVFVSYAAIKVDEDLWAVTGDGRYSNGVRHNFQQLLEWLTTGPNLVQDVQKATGFAPVDAPATK